MILISFTFTSYKSYPRELISYNIMKITFLNLVIEI